MIEAKLTLLEMKIKGVVVDSVEPGESSFGRTPERLDPVNVIRLVCELILSMFDSEVLFVSHVYEAVIARPTITVNDGL